MKKGYLTLALLVLISASCSKSSEKKEEQAVKGCMDKHSFNYNKDAKVDDGSCKKAEGCVQGFSSGAHTVDEIGDLVTTLDNPEYDAAINAEVKVQHYFFGAAPTTTYIIKEYNPNARNAFAYAPTQSTYIGYWFWWAIVPEHGYLPAYGMMAHEMGHRIQQHLNFSGYQYYGMQELEADAMSGYYMAMYHGHHWDQMEHNFMVFYGAGNEDYQYTDPDFHGTKDQRLKSVYLGWNTAQYAIQNNVSYDWTQLHAHFLEQIKTLYAGRNPNAGRPLQGRKLPESTLEQRMKLFPK